jgi:hypothetical protein
MSTEFTFDEKALLVTSAFVERKDEQGEVAIPYLVQVFEQLDLAGPLALAHCEGWIEIKSDEVNTLISDAFAYITAHLTDEELDEAKKQSVDYLVSQK